MDLADSDLPVWAWVVPVMKGSLMGAVGEQVWGAHSADPVESSDWGLIPCVPPQEPDYPFLLR